MKLAISFFLMLVSISVGVEFRASARVRDQPSPVAGVKPAEIVLSGSYDVRSLCEVLSELQGTPYILFSETNAATRKITLRGKYGKSHVEDCLHWLGYDVHQEDGVFQVGRIVASVSDLGEQMIPFVPAHRKPSEIVRLVTASGVTPPLPSPLPVLSPALQGTVATNDSFATRASTYLADDAAGVLYLRGLASQMQSELDRLAVLDQVVPEYDVSLRVVEVSSEDTRAFRLGINTPYGGLAEQATLDATIREIIKGQWLNWNSARVSASSTRLRGKIHNKESLDIRVRAGDSSETFSGASIGFVIQSTDIITANAPVEKVTRISTAQIGQTLKMAFSPNTMQGFFYEVSFSSTRQTGTVTLDGNPVPNTSDLRHKFAGKGVFGQPLVVAELAREASNMTKTDPGIPLLSWFGKTEKGFTDSRILFVLQVKGVDL